MRSTKTSNETTTTRSIALLAIALLAALGLSGCGGKRVPLATLTGRVTFQGQPVTNGVRIVFVNKETGTFIFAPLDNDGRYKVHVAEGYGLYPGEYKVAIRLNDPPISGVPGDAMPPPSRRADVPVRYGSSEKSGLILKLEPSGAVFDVDMKP